MASAGNYYHKEFHLACYNSTRSVSGPPPQNDQYLFDNIDKSLDIYCLYVKIVLAGDFNTQTGKGYLTPFLYLHYLHSIDKNPTCYKNTNNQDLQNQLSSEQPKDYAFFEKIFLSILEEHVPLKKKVLRVNHTPCTRKLL